jgi:hypothetical protein
MASTEYVDPRFAANGERLMDAWAVEDVAAEVVEVEALRARLAGRGTGLPAAA